MSTDPNAERWTLERMSGILLIVGFVMLVAGGLAAPSGAYQGSIEERLSIIDANQTQWLLSKVFDALAVVLVSVGFVMLASRGWRSGWPMRVVGVCFGLAGLLGVVYVYLLATDPRPLYDRDAPAPIAATLIGLLAAGLMAWGVHLLRSGFPRWVGVLSTVLGTGVLAALALILIVRPGPELAFAVASVVYLGILIIGLVLVRRRPRVVSGVG